MAFTSMHMAVGMACTGAAGVAACMVIRRGWRWIPLVMTLGAIWAVMPDLPRMVREQLAWLPLSQLLGSRGLEEALASWGNVFFFHRWLNSSTADLTLAGFALMFLMYNLSIVGLMMFERRHARRAMSLPWDGRERRLGMQSKSAVAGDAEGYRLKIKAAVQGRRMHQVRSSHLSRLA